jgi:hypothetical protein
MGPPHRLNQHHQKGPGEKMIVSGSLAIILVAIVIFFIRRNSIRAGYAIICFLAGFAVASTSIAPTIRRFLGIITTWFASIHV